MTERSPNDDYPPGFHYKPGTCLYDPEAYSDLDLDDVIAHDIGDILWGPYGLQLLTLGLLSQLLNEQLDRNIVDRDACATWFMAANHIVAWNLVRDDRTESSVLGRSVLSLHKRLRNGLFKNN